MEFLTNWLWYLVAFAIGALIAYVIAGLVVKPRSEEEAFEDLVRDVRAGEIR